jgi:phage repressor protein C with HTH and peptisase S24 domain
VPDLTRAARLRQARVAAGYARPVDAAIAFGWNRSTYFAHENGHRGISRDRVSVYAIALRVRAEWLAYGHGQMRGGARRIRIEAHLGDLATMNEQVDRLDGIDLPEGMDPEDFIAVQVHGNAYYPAYYDRDIILTERHHGPPEDYLGKRCVITLRDGTQIVRELRRGTRTGLFLLISHNAPPMEDVEIGDAAPIKGTWIV